MTGATGNIYYGLHEFREMAFLLHLLRPGDVFVDIGSNIGSYTVLASKVCGAHSISFEPDPGAYASLSANIIANDLSSLTTPLKMALGANAGQIHFTVGLDTMNRVVDEAESMGPTQMVEVSTLDAELNGRAPTFMKIDVEGFEASVIQGATKTLSNPSLVALMLETVDTGVLAVLEHHGFKRYAYDPFARSLSPPDPTLQECNQLFVRNLGLVSKRVSEAATVRVLGVDL